MLGLPARRSCRTCRRSAPRVYSWRSRWLIAPSSRRVGGGNLSGKTGRLAAGGGGEELYRDRDRLMRDLSPAGSVCFGLFITLALWAMILLLIF